MLVLVLTRRMGVTIRIGDDTLVTVLALKGNSVRIGVDAQKTVVVHREEIYDRVAAMRKREDAGEKH